MTNRMFLLAIGLLILPVTDQFSPTDKEKALAYLSRYGYMADDTDFTNALRTMQEDLGIPVTGEVDEVTKMIMDAPRCGGFSHNSHPDSRRLKRYALLGFQWVGNDLTYKIVPKWGIYTPDLSNVEVENTIARAFQAWSRVTPLTFTRVHASRPADLELSFASGYHGDGYPFDGRSGTLAHALLPEGFRYPYVRIHFDDDEHWFVNDPRGASLYHIAVHEIGHGLGLGHSNYFDAIMYSLYFFKYDPQLHSDDKRGIQRLYGSNPNPATTRPTVPARLTTPTRPPSTTTTRPPTTTTRPPTTMRGVGRPAPTTFNPIQQTATAQLATGVRTTRRLGTATQAPRPRPTMLRRVHTTVGLRLTTPRYDRPRTTGRPRAGNPYTTPYYYRVWRGKRSQNSAQSCPENMTIDSVFSIENQGTTYVFQGELYYLLERDIPAPGFPRRIADTFPYVGTSVDAALALSERSGRSAVRTIIYLMKGDRMWKLDGDLNPVWPGNQSRRIMEHFRGVPADIDGAFYYRPSHAIFFFKGDVYYRISYYGTNTENGLFVDKDYPQPISRWNLPVDVRRIDAVFTWGQNHRSYFFSGSQYYRYDDSTSSVDTLTLLPYPRPIHQWWLGCSDVTPEVKDNHVTKCVPEINAIETTSIRKTAQGTDIIDREHTECQVVYVGDRMSAEIRLTDMTSSALSYHTLHSPCDLLMLVIYLRWICK